MFIIISRVWLKLISLSVVDARQGVSNTRGMLHVIRKMCTHYQGPSHDEGYGILRPWEIFEKADLRLLADLHEVADGFH